MRREDAAAWTHERRLLASLPWVILIASLLLAAATVAVVSSVIAAKDERRFHSRSHAIRDRIAGRLDTYVAMLLAARGWLESEPAFSCERLRGFVAALDLPRRYPGVQGIGYTAVLHGEETALLEERMRAAGLTGFRVWPPATRAERHAVICLEPLDERNRAAIGFDMSSDPTRREAMERARATGEPAASGRVRLVQEIAGDEQAGFLIYVPVRPAGEQRRLAGYVYSPFRAGDLLEGIFGTEPEPSVDFALYDAPAPEPGALLHASGDLPGGAGRLRELIPLVVAGRTWTLDVRSNPDFAAGSGDWLVPYFAAVCLVLGLGGFLITRTQVRARLAAERARQQASAEAAVAEAFEGCDDLAVCLERLGAVLRRGIARACCVRLPGGPAGSAAASAAAAGSAGATAGAADAGLAAILDGDDGLAARARMAGGAATRALPAGHALGAAAVAVPLHVHGERIGALGLSLARTPAAWQLELVESLARRAELGIERVLLLREARVAAGEARAAQAEAQELLAVAALLGRELDLERVVQTVTDAATRLTGADFGAFFYNVSDPAGGSYMLYTLSGAPREAFAGFPMPRATPIFAPTFRGEGVIRLDDVRRDPRYGQWGPHHGMPPGHLPVVSYLACPVRVRGGEVLGGLFFGHREPGRFTDRHERLAVGVADQAAVALDNARLYAAEREARRLAAAHAEELARSNAELQQFAYVSSHDLKQPARQVASFLDLVERRHLAALPAEGQAFVRRAREGAQRMTAVIDDLLAYTRLAGEEPPDQQVQLRRCFDEAVENLRAAIAERGADVTCGELPAVLGNRVLLVQLLQNLIENGIKFGRREGPRVRVEAQREGEQWIVTVADDGAGIEERYRERIFEPFQRLHGSDVPGTGIGLAICRKIVERHGGRIWVESGADGGTRMRFTLRAA